jgi:DNA-directed RNA polymerase subunit alpha
MLKDELINLSIELRRLADVLDVVTENLSEEARQTICDKNDEIPYGLFSVRTENAFDLARIKTFSDLCRNSGKDLLLRVRNFGKCSLKEVKYKLSELNMSLSDEHNK